MGKSGLNECDAVASAAGAGVRWDAVVTARAASIGSAPLAAPSPVPDRCAHPVQVHVQLFGALAVASAERSIRLELPASATIADALTRAEQRLGGSLLAQILDETGAKRRHCRLFVGGHAVENLQTPLDGAADPTEIDIILLIAPEGG